MEAVCYNRKLGGRHYPLAFIAMLILLLLNANSCSGGAAVGIQLVKSNNTFGCNIGRLEECLIMEDDLELEFLMNPYISRFLQQSDHPSDTSKNPGQTITCGQPNDPGYSQCINRIKAKQGQHNCDPKRSNFNRNSCG